MIRKIYPALKRRSSLERRFLPDRAAMPHTSLIPKPPQEMMDDRTFYEKQAKIFKMNIYIAWPAGQDLIATAMLVMKSLRQWAVRVPFFLTFLTFINDLYTHPLTFLSHASHRSELRAEDEIMKSE
jgi:hypothetical protein